MSLEPIVEVTEQLENGQKTQKNVEHSFDHLCELLNKDMDKYCAVKKGCKEELQNNCSAEKKFLRHKDKCKRRKLKMNLNTVYLYYHYNMYV